MGIVLLRRGRYCFDGDNVVSMGIVLFDGGGIISTCQSVNKGGAATAEG